MLAALVGCVALAARAAPRATAWDWVAIVLVRAAATNLSDWQVLTPGERPTVRSPLSFPVVIAAWGLALAGLSVRGRARGGSRLAAGPWFWATMLTAGVLGTAVGDWLAFRSGSELPGAAALSTVVLAAALAALSGPAGRGVGTSWLLVAVVRTWGTNAGDLLSDAAGLLPVTLASALVTAAVLYRCGPLLQPQPGPNP